MRAIRAVGGDALLRDRERLFLRRARGGGGGELRTRGLVSGAGRITPRGERFGIGQPGQRRLRRLQLARCSGALIGEVGARLFELARAFGMAGECRLRAVERTQRLALGLRSGFALAFGAGEIRLSRIERRARFAHAGVRIGGGLLQFGQSFGQRGEAVGRFEPRRLRAALAAHDQPVPPAQRACQRDQPGARLQSAAIIRLDHLHPREARAQFLGAVAEMMQQRIGHRLGLRRAGPEASILRLGHVAQRAAAIAPQHRGQRRLVTGRGTHAIERDRLARLGSARLVAVALVLFERGMLAFDARQLGARFGKRFLRLFEHAACGIARLAVPFYPPGQRFLRFARLRCGGLRLGQRLLGVLRAGLLARALLQPFRLARKLGDPPLRRVERGARNAPFGIERGVVRIGARELQLC